MRRRHFQKLNLEKVGRFFVLKSKVREIVASKSAFNATVKAKAEVNYQVEIFASTRSFIPFEEAWLEVLSVIAQLDIPEN